MTSQERAEYWNDFTETPIHPPPDGAKLTVEELKIVMKGLRNMATPHMQNQGAKAVHAAVSRALGPVEGLVVVPTAEQVQEWMNQLPVISNSYPSAVTTTPVFDKPEEQPMDAAFDKYVEDQMKNPESITTYSNEINEIKKDQEVLTPTTETPENV